MNTTITRIDLENQQRFVAERLGAPEFIVPEAKAQRSADRLHDCICSAKQWTRTL